MAIETTKRKTGRPIGFYRSRTGDRIDGLTRNAAGRWRISSTGEFFTEADEDRALKRFYEATMKQAPTVTMVTATAVPTAYDAIVRGGKIVDQVMKQFRQETVSRGEGYEHRLIQNLDETTYWQRVTKDLLDHADYAAAKTGIASLAWLPELKKPGTSHTLKELGDLYAARQDITANELSRSVLFWNEFRNAVGVNTVRDITHDLVAAYGNKMRTAGHAAKTLHHRFAKVRSVLHYAIKLGKSISDCRQALDCCTQLEVKQTANKDPQPIGVADFWKIYDAAVKANDKVFAALMITALNAGMYGSEVSALLWEEVDLTNGELVTRRNKTGISRIAMLWPETLKALKALPHTQDTIFNTRIRSYTTHSVIAGWARYRKAAGVAVTVTFSHLRDAAYTLALKVSWQQAEMIAGHQLPGTSDHYLRRNPGLVKEACEAIRAGYLPRPRKTSTRAK